MRLRIVVPVVLTFLLATPKGSALLVQKQSIAKLIAAVGKVELKRDGQSAYRSVAVNESLYHGDLLRVARGARGVIRCTSDSTIWTIPPDGIPRGVSNTCSPPARS